MNGIEAMTRHALVKGGIAADDLPMLVHHALHGHGPSRRRLESAIRERIYITLPHEDDGSCPLEYPNDRYRRDGILYARIEVAGFVWNDRSISGTLPETLHLALEGRPLRDLVDADFVPDATLMRTGVAGRLVTFDRIVSALPKPTVPQRLAWLPRRWRLFFDEGMMDGPKPAWMIRTMLMVTLATALMGVLVGYGPGRSGGLDAVPAVLLAIATVNGVWFVANGLRRRQFSLFHAWTAATRHNVSVCS